MKRSNRLHLQGGAGLAQPELIEAASRTADRDGAEAALDMLREQTQAGATDWGLGVEARASALLADDDRAESLYRTAIERLGRTSIRTDLARAELLYGEGLRRQGRRLEARELRPAHATFAEIGASIFLDRAAAELLATGERARQHTAATRSELTPQETHVAGLARKGLSNPEIGARLFTSPKTVEYHLHKVFTKLEISSRNKLQRVLPSEAREAQPTYVRVSRAAGRRYAKCLQSRVYHRRHNPAAQQKWLDWRAPGAHSHDLQPICQKGRLREPALSQLS